jgi:hypothetical protein
MQVKSNGAAAVKVFWKKYYPERSAGVEIFLQKPAGLDLYCREAALLTLHGTFLRGRIAYPTHP